MKIHPLIKQYLNIYCYLASFLVAIIIIRKYLIVFNFFAKSRLHHHPHVGGAVYIFSYDLDQYRSSNSNLFGLFLQQPFLFHLFYCFLLAFRL